MKNETKFLAGKLVNTHGLKGGMKLLSFMKNPVDIFSHNLQNSDEEKIEITKIGSPLKKNLFLVSIKGISTKEQADDAKKTEIFIDKKELDENEFFYENLIGLKVIDLDKTPVGIVISVQNYGAGDILEIKDNEGKDRLISFQKEICKVEKNEIIIDAKHLL
ncbi:MAG: ribosome maturation factor RimM [Alphaproteobacteria bacterium]